jgi:hypothetical protein
MPRVRWPLAADRPIVEVVLALASGQTLRRCLLADTGAGTAASAFDLILHEADCVNCGGLAGGTIVLGGAYQGSFPLYDVPIQIPAIGFDEDVRVVGVQASPPGCDGIACFRFINRFTYGNFGDPGQFGLEM